MNLFLVGGTVRDWLLKRPASNDVDFAVEAESFDAMKNALAARGLRVWQERPEFVTLRGKLPTSELGDFGGLLKLGRGTWLDADFTLCRSETMYHDKRHPSTVTPASLKVDLARRDFTVNAVAVSENGTWHDPHYGQADAKGQWLRTVGNAQDRFNEDPLRMLRAFRFAVMLNLSPVHEVVEACWTPELLELLGTLPVERVRQELGKAFAHDWFRAVQQMGDTFLGLGKAVSKHHPNLWLKATTEDK